MKRLVLVAAMLIIVPCSYGQFGSTMFTAFGNMAEGGAMFSYGGPFDQYLAGNWFKNWDYIRTGGFGSINHFTRFQ
jgi:hypothetical protein